MWASRPRAPVGQTFSSRLPPTPLPQANIPRSPMVSYQQIPLSTNWVSVHLHGMVQFYKFFKFRVILFLCVILFSHLFQNDKQMVAMCNKIVGVYLFVCPPGSPFVYIKFTDSAEVAINRLKNEAPYRLFF